LVCLSRSVAGRLSSPYSTSSSVISDKDVATHTGQVAIFRDFMSTLLQIVNVNSYAECFNVNNGNNLDA
jgi:hypothetical protein